MGRDGTPRTRPARWPAVITASRLLRVLPCNRAWSAVLVPARSDESFGIPALLHGS